MIRRAVLALWLLCLASTASQAAVAFDAKTATWTSVSGVATLTISNLTVGSGSNRALALALMCGSCGAGLPAGLSLTWDSGGTNQALTQVTGTLVTDSVLTDSAAMYGLVAPTAGNKSLVISWTGNNEMHAAAISFTGVDQTSVAVAFPHGTNAKVNGASPTTITITSAVGNMVVAAHAQNLSVFGVISDTTLAVDNASGPNTANAANYAAGAATKTLTAAFTGSGPWNSIGTDVLAAAAASSCPLTLSRMGVGC